MDVVLKVKVADVLKEVEQGTHYAGGKMTGDDGAFVRISTTDEDKSQLMLFWNEARADVVQAMLGIVQSETMGGDDYTLTLNVSSSFDSALKDSMQVGLHGFFVQRILSRWYAYTNKGEAGQYADNADALLKEIREKAFYKMKPRRPTYN